MQCQRGCSHSSFWFCGLYNSATILSTKISSWGVFFFPLIQARKVATHLKFSCKTEDWTFINTRNHSVEFHWKFLLWKKKSEWNLFNILAKITYIALSLDDEDRRIWIRSRKEKKGREIWSREKGGGSLLQNERKLVETETEIEMACSCLILVYAMIGRQAGNSQEMAC